MTTEANLQQQLDKALANLDEANRQIAALESRNNTQAQQAAAELAASQALNKALDLRWQAQNLYVTELVNQQSAEVVKAMKSYSIECKRVQILNDQAALAQMEQ